MIEKIRHFWDALFKPAKTAPASRGPLKLSTVDYIQPPGPSRARELYFAGGGPDERKMVNYNHVHHVLDEEGKMRLARISITDVVRVEIQKFEPRPLEFEVRQMDRHLLFCELGRPPSEDLLFLPDTPIERFGRSFRRRPPGRCILHAPRCMRPNHCVYLFFDIDGTGFALHPALRRDRDTFRKIVQYERVNFRWDDFPSVPPDLLTTPVSKLRTLCEDLFEERINLLLRNPYQYREKLPEIPLSWRSGSEQELRLLVQAICCTEPGLFDTPEAVTVVFQSTTPYKRGGFRKIEKGYLPVISPRLMSLCDLAFRLNECVGMKWIEHSSAPGNIQKSAIRLQFSVDPPSAHEKAEAYLTLMDWLDSTLHNPEKRERFNLPPRPQSRDPA